MAIKRLNIEYKQYLKEPSSHYSININENNMLNWKVLIFGPSETIYESGIFECEFFFPKEYPNKPPKFKFITNIVHPNIYSDGKVCISILHDGIDEFNYEDISERWNPSHSVNSILISILNILSEPNLESPANIDIGKMWRNDFPRYKRIIYEIISNN
jgi:ubiquitin-conjugating enzyme E2 G1